SCIEDSERVHPLDPRGAPYRLRAARVRDDVETAASQRLACRQRYFSGASPSRMSEENQRAQSQFQTRPVRDEAAGDSGGRLKRFGAILRFKFGCVRMALSTHSATLTLLAGKTVRSPPVLINHRMKRAFESRPCIDSFNCFVSCDLRSSLTATSEPSFKNWSPLAISESDSTCDAADPAIETDEFVLAVLSPDFFTCRAKSVGVFASQSLAVLSQLAVRIHAPSGLNTADRTVP